MWCTASLLRNVQGAGWHLLLIHGSAFWHHARITRLLQKHSLHVHNIFVSSEGQEGNLAEACYGATLNFAG
eukprot:12880811-Prorocentrum_lima.AAC.1